MNNKHFSILIILFVLLVTSCKTTPPVQDTILSIENTSILQSQNLLKIYFLQFQVNDEETGKSYFPEGDGTFIILPDGKCMLIDCFADEAGDELVKFLKSLNIKKIDYFIATHYHRDHIGSMSTLLSNFEFGEIYSNGAEFDTRACNDFLSLMDLYDLEVQTLKEGDQLFLSAYPYFCKIDVYWPTLDKKDLFYVYCQPGHTEKMRNNTSLVFKLTYNDFSALFTGDIYKSVDTILSKKYMMLLKSNVLKVPHHGEYYTANSLEFLKTVAPEIAIVEDNQYINSIISKRYKKANINLLYRNTPGYILVQSDGVKYNVSEKEIK